jgi:hypothetical protein
MISFIKMTLVKLLLSIWETLGKLITLGIA